MARLAGHLVGPQTVIVINIFEAWDAFSLGDQELFIHIPIPKEEGPFISCVTLGKSLCLSEPLSISVLGGVGASTQ